MICRRPYHLAYISQEGPHSCLNEEEFFDAVDASLDKLEKEQEEVMEAQACIFFLFLIQSKSIPRTRVAPEVKSLALMRGAFGDTKVPL